MHRIEYVLHVTCPLFTFDTEIEFDRKECSSVGKGHSSGRLADISLGLSVHK